VAYNFITPEESQRMIELIDQKVEAKAYRKRQEFDSGEQQIFDMKEFNDSLVDSIRQRVDEFTKAHFGQDIHIESSYMKVRVPGKQEYAHPIHADNCEYNKFTDECTVEAKTDFWVSHSVLVYLNRCEGGEFFFVGGETLVPEPGLIVGFSSGPENLHGVNKIKSGNRYAIAMWFTKEPERREKYI
jgi:hypothetical protein